ncbi:MAG TPA: class I SAM-dependent methyltransferase [Ktedonobacterales bacterium]|nr:class I SAM-dependent methyltransferase [Ktedonobacterales bacterium]
MITPRPAHLSAENASRFQDADVVAAYPRRFPYPEEAFDVLEELLIQTGDSPRAVLDVGTGDGSLARRLVTRAAVERVDALDQSAAMLALARSLPNGDHPHLHWIEGQIETAPLDPPYALITAGDSLHWFDWEVALPRLADTLTPRGLLAIAHRTLAEEPPWAEDRDALIVRYSAIHDYQDYDLIRLLTERGLFAQLGERTTRPISFTRTIDDDIEAAHSMSSLARSAMAPENIAAFDTALRATMAPYADEHGLIHMQVVGHIVWGKPLYGKKTHDH